MQLPVSIPMLPAVCIVGCWAGWSELKQEAPLMQWTLGFTSATISTMAIMKVLLWKCQKFQMNLEWKDICCWTISTLMSWVKKKNSCAVSWLPMQRETQQISKATIRCFCFCHILSHNFRHLQKDWSWSDLSRCGGQQPFYYLSGSYVTALPNNKCTNHTVSKLSINLIIRHLFNNTS